MRFENYLLEIEKLNNKRDRENICLHGIHSIIKTIYLELKEKHHRKLTKKIFNELKIPYQTLYSWTTGHNPIPISKAYGLLNLWKESCGKSEKEFYEKWDLLYKINQGYSQNGERRVILPKEFNEDLAYIIGFFQGDGYLKKERLKGFQEYSIHFYESDKKVLERINNIMHKYFGICGNIYFQSDNKGSWYKLRFCSKPIYLFCKNILNLKAGKKEREVGVPRIIKKSQPTIQLSFIRGFFDAEGGVGETKKNPWLEMGQASKDAPCEILTWIRAKLIENKIILSEPRRSRNWEFFRIRTAKRETIKKFFEIISSDHPKKIIKFNQIINR